LEGARPRSVDDPDLLWLERAAALGRRGWGRTHPNPLVGCVLVQRGEVVGEGHHDEFGGPHAEVVALGAAGAAAAGSTAYVSLEPCHHHGKTPPCSAALKEAGVTRVIYGAADPGEGGGGGRGLASMGVEVRGPLFDLRRSRLENPAFFHGVEGGGLPHVTLKLALSLDGRIAAAPGERTPLSGRWAAAWVHRLRAGFDGILVGARTARVDDPLLTVRGDWAPRVPPTRVILDPAGTVTHDMALFRDLPGVPLLVLVGPDAPRERTERLESAGARVRTVATAAGGRGLDLRDALGACREAGMTALLCEGGGRLAGALLGDGLLGRMVLIRTPHILGSRGVPAFPHGVAAGEWMRWRRSAPPVLLGNDVVDVLDREV